MCQREYRGPIGHGRSGQRRKRGVALRRWCGRCDPPRRRARSPVYGRDEPAADLLANCYRNARGLAERHGIESIAFPAISTGVFGYPPAEAAAVALRTILEYAPKLKTVRRIRFVLFDDASLALHETALERLTDPA
jgi:O-acetyl-ADP-ribose deacetylase (regulator of RNase III)